MVTGLGHGKNVPRDVLKPQHVWLGQCERKLLVAIMEIVFSVVQSPEIIMAESILVEGEMKIAYLNYHRPAHH